MTNKAVDFNTTIFGDGVATTTPLMNNTFEELAATITSNNTDLEHALDTLAASCLTVLGWHQHDESDQEGLRRELADKCCLEVCPLLRQPS